MAPFLSHSVGQSKSQVSPIQEEGESTSLLQGRNGNEFAAIFNLSLLLEKQQSKHNDKWQLTFSLHLRDIKGKVRLWHLWAGMPRQLLPGGYVGPPSPEDLPVSKRRANYEFSCEVSAFSV